MSGIDPWLGKKSSKAIVASTLFAVALGVVIYRLLPSETLEQAARNFDDCLISRDTGCMFEYMHPEEIALLKFNERDFDKFMSSYVYSQLAGFSPKGDIQLQLVDTQTELYLSSARVFQNPDGREVRLGFRIHMGDEQPYVICALMNLALMSCQADLSPGVPVPTGLGKFEYLVQCYKKHLPTWEAANVHGYTRVSDSATTENVFEYRRFDDAIVAMSRRTAANKKD